MSVQYMHKMFPLSCKEHRLNFSSVEELTFYYHVYGYCDGPLADADIQITHLLGKIIELRHVI